MDSVALDSQQPQKRPYVPKDHLGTSRRTLIIIASIVGALLIAGMATVYIFHKRTKLPVVAISNNIQTQTPTVQPTPTTTSTSVSYVSNGQDLNLNFMYPTSWTVTPPTTSNATDGTITVMSPLISIVGADNASHTSRIILTIRPGHATLSELATGKATAGQASAQIAYTKPTAAQHQYPYLTYVHLAGGINATNAFEEVIVTGIMTFTKDQAILPESLSQLDPVISARLYACADQGCNAASSTPLSITNNTWLQEVTCQQALEIMQSLQIN